MRRLTASIIAMLPSHALAHGQENVPGWWTYDPWVWTPIALCVVLYVRGMLLQRRMARPLPRVSPWSITGFTAGIAALFLALIWPLDALAEVSFAAHMAQHMLLIAVAAPLLTVSRPLPLLLIGMPSSWRRGNRHLGAIYRGVNALATPRVAFALHGILIWLWHAPFLFEAALRWQSVHVAEHVTLLGSALLFWHALRQTGRPGGEGYGAAALWILGTLIHTGMLGALITFSPRLLYMSYADTSHHFRSPMDDQQLAGLLMWIPGGLCYLVAGLACAAAWLRCGEREGLLRKGQGSP
ncbi:MAG TPA: cytochrome c oxidase assembly protein [Noviherbaspirillum sp.]